MNQKRKMRYTSEKGITLIALVITIIVLLILAGVTISMVLGDDGIIARAQQAKTENKKTSELERVKLAVTSAAAKGGGKIDLEDATKDNSIEKALNKEFGNENAGEKPIYANGEIQLTNGQKYIVTSSGTLTKYVEPSPITSPSPSVAQWSLTDNDSSGQVSVGDLLTPTVTGLETEKFYVIADDGTTLTLLAETCINTTTYKQAGAGNEYSTVKFDDETNVYANSSIRGTVKNYVDTLNGLNLQNVEVVYGGEPETEVKGRLMWDNEVMNSTFKAATNYKDILYGPKGARINYWLGTPNIEFENIVSIIADGEWVETGIYDSSRYGLRPVIKILKSNVQ